MAFLLNGPSTEELQRRAGPALGNVAPAPTAAPAPSPVRAPPEAALTPHRARKKFSDLEGSDPWNYYTQGDLLGEGTYAKVYSCVDKTTGDEFACKIFCKASLTVHAMEREIEAMLNASHPFLCSVHRVFMYQKVLHLVMDLVRPPFRGGAPDLMTWLDSTTETTERDAATIIRNVALAVQYLNAPPLCCMHRDLKPGNILVGPDGIDHLKVGDLGFAKPGISRVPVNGGLRRIHTVKAGTPSYMAPEVIGGDYGNDPFKVDVFSLGCIAYVSLRRYFPFGQEEHETFANIKADRCWDGQSPRNHLQTCDDWQSASRECRDAIGKMLEHDQDARYSIEQVLEDPWIVSMAAAIY